MGLPSIGQGRSTALGVLLIMAAVVSYGFALNVARPVQQRSGALPVMARSSRCSRWARSAPASPTC
jgi:hypothetical protein